MISTVWILRIVVGGVFIISGVAKMIDPYGFIYKIQQYLAVWGWDVPESLILVSSVALSGFEFLCGISLATGSYKRVSVWILTAVMAGMLPLSIYIAIADPVDDCGCFGDFIVISNSLTCLKNVAITVALVWLILYNRRVQGIYWPYLQWIQIALGAIYIAVIGIIGYHEQPLLDFRSYKVGTSLFECGSENGDLRFIYERNGEKHEFAADELPDSSWTYVDRIDHALSEDNALVLYDLDGDTDVTDDVADAMSDGDAMVLLIPDVHKAGVANTYIINELNSYMTSRGGEMLAIIGSDKAAAENWIDMAMAEYPVYLAEATAIKEIARGNMAVVYTKNGIIQWKRTLWSIGDGLIERGADSGWLDSEDMVSGSRRFWTFTALLIGALLFLWGLSRSAIGLRHHFSRKNEKKNVNLQQIEISDNTDPDIMSNKDFTNKDKEDLQ